MKWVFFFKATGTQIGTLQLQLERKLAVVGWYTLGGSNCLALY